MHEVRYAFLERQFPRYFWVNPKLDIQYRTSPASLLDQKSAPVHWRQPFGKSLRKIHSFPAINTIVDSDQKVIGCMGGKPSHLLQCSHAVSVVAACNDRISQGVVGHLNRGVVCVRLLSRSSCDETRLLIVIDLSRLYVSNLWIIEVAQDIHEEIRVRYMVGIKGRDDLVPVKADLIEPGIVVS